MADNILEVKKLKEITPIYILINTLDYINDKASSQKLIYFLKFELNQLFLLLFLQKQKQKF